VIFLKTFWGKTVSLNVEKKMKVKDVKLLIQAKEGVPPDQQRLVFADQVINDKKTMGDYNIQKDSTLHIVLRTRGGEPAILIYPRNIVRNVKVSVKLSEKAWEFSTHYPKTKNTNTSLEWSIDQVNPHGRILIKDREYPYLFWKAYSKDERMFDFNQYEPIDCVRRDVIIEYLYQILLNKGMREKDISDMITFWLERLTKKKYVYIQFMSKSRYDKLVKTTISIPHIEMKVIFMLFYADDVIISSKKCWKPTEQSDLFMSEDNIMFEWGGMEIFNQTVK